MIYNGQPLRCDAILLLCWGIRETVIAIVATSSRIATGIRQFRRNRRMWLKKIRNALRTQCTFARTSSSRPIEETFLGQTSIVFVTSQVTEENYSTASISEDITSVSVRNLLCTFPVTRSEQFWNENSRQYLGPRLLPPRAPTIWTR
jgi:hypothetical protein